MKPNHIIRFEKLQSKGRLYYLVSTAFMVCVLISAIQWFNTGTVDPRSIALYAFLGTLIAQVDWLILARRYHKFNHPDKV